MSVKTRAVFSSAGPTYQARDPGFDAPDTYACAHVHTHTHRKKMRMTKTTTVKTKEEEEGVSVAFWNKSCTRCGGTHL